MYLALFKKNIAYVIFVKKSFLRTYNVLFRFEFYEGLILFQARKALEKYLHYYARWENHAKSRKLEEKALADLESCINDQVRNF